MPLTFPHTARAGTLLGALAGLIQAVLFSTLYPWLPTDGFLDAVGFGAFVVVSWALAGGALSALAHRIAPRSPGPVLASVLAAIGAISVGMLLQRYGRSPFVGTGLLVEAVVIAAAAGTGLLIGQLARLPRLQTARLAFPLLVLTSFAMSAQLLDRAEATPEPAAVHDLQPSTLTLPAHTNILFLTADTLRADHLSGYGYPRQTSPALDALAADGIRFDAPITQKTHTAPAMASLMTGRYPHEHGLIANGSPIGSAENLLAERLSGAGYQTAAISTNGWLTPGFGFDQGFADFDAHPITDQEEMLQEAAYVTDNARGWLQQQRDPSRPFFLWLHYVDPHGPYLVPEEGQDRFMDDELSAIGRDVTIESGWGKGRVQPPLILDDARDLSDYIARYDAEIRYMDDHIGRLLSWMDSEGLLEDTLIVFTADHGESLGEHGYLCFHGESTTDAEARVPLIVSHPALPSGEVIEQPVELIDVVPTVLGMLGLPRRGTSGDDLTSLLTDADAVVGGGLAFTEGRYRRGYATRCVRSEDWKLSAAPVEAFAPLDRLLELQWSGWRGAAANPYDCRVYKRTLRDLRGDPAEEINHYADHAAEAAVLERALREHVQRTEYASAPEEIEIDDATRENLRALGYIQ